MGKKKTWKILLGLTVLSVGAGLLAGCSSSSGKDYDVYFFNGKSEIATSLESVAKDYEKETGKKVKVFTNGTAESLETLRSELNSKQMPTIMALNQTSITEMVEGGFALEASKVPNEKLKGIYDSVPDNMQLKYNGEGEYGIPYNIEGYGLIVNTQMLKDVYGLTDTEQFVNDFKLADYSEFEKLITATDDYIKGKGQEEFTLNGTAYTTAGEKTDLTKNLNGVFSIAGAEKWTYGNHFTNYAANAVFPDYSSTAGATKEEVAALEEPLVKSLLEAEFLSDYAAGPNGAITRGNDFVNSTITGYDQAVQTFAQGKALFIKQGNWIYSTVKTANSEFADNLIMLPMKLNFSGEDITAKGMTVDKLNQSVAEFVSQYYVINAKASEQEVKDAADFLVWLNTSDEGLNYIINEFGFVPFNADENTKLDNPLSNSLISYKVAGNILANDFDAYPASWGLNSIGTFMMEKLFTSTEPLSESEIREGVKQSIAEWQENISQ